MRKKSKAQGSSEPEIAAQNPDGNRNDLGAPRPLSPLPDEMDLEFVDEIWARRAAQLAQVPIQEAEGERLGLVLVQSGQELYGLEAQYVLDIRRVELLTPVPRVPDWVSGVVSLQGRILSVVDLARFFGLPPAQAPEAETGNSARTGQDDGNGNGFLLVVEAEGMELAFLADDVLAIEELPATQIQEATDAIRGIHPEYVHGLTSHLDERGRAEHSPGENPVVVLNLSTLLADERLIVREELM